MKACLAGCLVPVAIMVTALAVNGASPAAVLSAHRHSLAGYGVFLAIQMVPALLATAAIAVAVAAAGSVVRRLARWAGLRPDGPVWRGLTADAVVSGIIVTGAYLGWAPTDVYSSPDGPQSVEVRPSSLIEAPLGLGAGSDCFVPVRVTWRDGGGHCIVQGSSELKYCTSVERISSRGVSWGRGDAQRVVVVLPETGSYLFFPDPVEEGSYCPPESAVEAYLRGEPVAAVERLCRDDRAQ